MSAAEGYHPPPPGSNARLMHRNRTRSSRLRLRAARMVLRARRSDARATTRRGWIRSTFRTCEEEGRANVRTRTLPCETHCLRSDSSPFLRTRSNIEEHPQPGIVAQPAQRSYDRCRPVLRPKEHTMKDKQQRILRELLERIATARELADVNIAAGVALEELDS
jgi:hypothetical protein